MKAWKKPHALIYLRYSHVQVKKKNESPVAEEVTKTTWKDTVQQVHQESLSHYTSHQKVCDKTVSLRHILSQQSTSNEIKTLSIITRKDHIPRRTRKQRDTSAIIAKHNQSTAEYTSNL